MIRARSATMVNLRSSFSVLVIGLGLCIAPQVQAQNPPMNCTPDGIIEVCTAADSVAAPLATEPVPAPAAMVIYKDGLLSISAENVSLSDVLHEVSAKTGATIEFPNGSATEPVFTHIGPGPVRDILATLLNGTKFNYVMLGSQNTADSLQKIVLTPAGQTTEAAQSEALSSPLPSAFSSRKTQLPVTPAQAAQRQAESTATFEARKQEMMPILRQRYAEMMEKAAAARASDQSSGSDSQAQPSGSGSQAQPSGPGSQAQPSGPGSQAQSTSSDSQAQPSGSGSQAQSSGSDSQPQQQQ
jgi:hypothetical protein